MDLSVVIPLYNEELNVLRLHEAITSALDPLAIEYEVVYVDDGSSDETPSITKNLALMDDRVAFVRFRKNYGQTPAMAAGMQHARGTIIVTMDGDLQNDPQDIPTFIDEIRNGYDLVVGWRLNRQDKAITRKLPSKIANWMIGKVTGIPIKDNGCSLKAYRSSLFKQIPLYAEMHRFIPAMSAFAGVRIKEIPVRHHARELGESKYGLSRIYKVLLDLITIRTLISSTRNPIYYFCSTAVVPILIGLLLLLPQVWSLFANGQWSLPLLGTATLFIITGSSLVFWGVLASILIETSDARKRRLVKSSSQVIKATTES